MTFTAGSLFSGVGGMDLGLEQAGIEIVWQVEIDEFRRSILEKHWPKTQRFSDITKITGRGLRPVDLICGGFPCQDLSHAGQRRGLEGERSGLFFELLRVVKVRKPRWLLVENVPGLLSQDKGEAIGRVIEAFSQLGYGLCWRVLDSQYFGVPQRRRRVYIAGHLGRPCPPAVLFEPTGGEGDPPARGKTGQEVANPLGAGSIGRRQDLELETYIPELAYGLPASARGTGDGHGNAWNSTYVIEDVAGKQSGNRRVGLGVREDTMYSLQRGHQHGISVRTDNTSSNGWGISEDGKSYEVRRGQAVLVGPTNRPDGRDWHEFKVSRSVNSQHQSSPGGSSGLVCTPADASRVRETTGDAGSLDVSLSCKCKDAPRYAACGDAVTVNVARWIGERLIVVDELVKEGIL